MWKNELDRNAFVQVVLQSAALAAKCDVRRLVTVAEEIQKNNPQKNYRFPLVTQVILVKVYELADEGSCCVQAVWETW